MDSQNRFSTATEGASPEKNIVGGGGGGSSSSIAIICRGHRGGSSPSAQMPTSQLRGGHLCRRSCPQDGKGKKTTEALGRGCGGQVGGGGREPGIFYFKVVIGLAKDKETGTDKPIRQFVGSLGGICGPWFMKLN